MSPVKSQSDDTPPRRRRGRPDEGAREKLVQAATSLFIERDYDSVATDMVPPDNNGSTDVFVRTMEPTLAGTKVSSPSIQAEVHF